MELKALLFDVNGTLIDIETDEGMEEIYRGIGHFLTYQGIYLHPGEIRELYFRIMNEQLGASREAFPQFDAVAIWDTILERHVSDYTRALPPEKRRQLPVTLAEMQRSLSIKRLEAYPGVKDALEQLREHYGLAVVTDAQIAYATAELCAAGLRDYFHPIIVSGDYGYHKPDPRLFNRALEQLQVRPEEAIFVGNNMYHDVYGAQQAGMKAVFYPSRFGDKVYKDTAADYIIYHFGQLLDAVRFLLAR